MSNEKVFINDSYFIDKYKIEEINEPLSSANCGTKLLIIREINSLNRKELSTILGYSESTISRIERGLSAPNTKFLNVLLAYALIGSITTSDAFSLNITNIASGMTEVVTLGKYQQIKLPSGCILGGIGILKGIEHICKTNDLSQGVLGDQIIIKHNTH